MSAYNVIGIFGRVENPKVKETLKTLIQYLNTLHVKILVETETAKALPFEVTNIDKASLANNCDLLIVVGGDGSMLQAAHTVIDKEIPVLGINRGKLGFLTDILPNELNKIADILSGKFVIEHRFLLETTLKFEDKILDKGIALNEVALIPDTMPHMNEFEVYIDDQFLCSQDSDGIIVATPTGSTAYALSGGGPILHPGLDAIVLVPMFPHTLSIRPIVIEGNSKVSLKIAPHQTQTPRVTCDNQTILNAPSGSTIEIQKKSKRLHLIHPVDYDYYATLRSKLHWGRKLHYME